jgi:hypothetical protein
MDVNKRNKILSQKFLKSLDGNFSHEFLKKEFKMLAIYSNKLIRKSKERKFMKVIREKSYKKIRIFLNFKFQRRC